MNRFENYIRKYLVLIFTDYGHMVAEGKLLFDLLGDDLGNMDVLIVTKEGQFIDIENANVNQILVIVHKEREPSEKLIKLLQKEQYKKFILAGIHNGTDKEIKEVQRELIRNANGRIKEYIHVLSEEMSPEWVSFSKICLAAYKRDKAGLIQNYVRLVELLISPVERISLLKHRIMHLLGPIDNDLQGLWDEAVRNERKRFDEEKWKEVCEAYKDHNWKMILMDALETIRESLEDLKKDLSEEDLKKDLSENKQEQVQKFMNSISFAINYLNGDRDEISTSDGFVKCIKEAKDLLDLIKIENIKKVYEALRKDEGTNSIHKLFNELDKTFEGLI